MRNGRVPALCPSLLTGSEAADEPIGWGDLPKTEGKLPIVLHQNGLSTVSARLIAPGSRLVGLGPSLADYAPTGKKKPCPACRAGL